MNGIVTVNCVYSKSLYGRPHIGAWLLTISQPTSIDNQPRFPIVSVIREIRDFVLDAKRISVGARSSFLDGNYCRVSFRCELHRKSLFHHLAYFHMRNVYSTRLYGINILLAFFISVSRNSRLYVPTLLFATTSVIRKGGWKI